jgi:hypothetical protein
VELLEVVEVLQDRLHDGGDRLVIHVSAGDESRLDPV